MNNADYWRGRFSIMADAAQKKADRCVADLEEMYREAEQAVQKDIESWYARFAANNGLSLSDARKMLTTGQMDEFRWTVEKYIQVGEQANLSPEWLKKLENASARFHVSRLEAVQIQIQQQMELLYGNQVDSIDGLLKQVVSNGYTRTAYEVQKQIGLGWDITALDQKKLETLLSKPWTADNKTFRDRCWEGKANLVSGVQTSLTQGLLRGDSSQKITDDVKRRFNVSRYQAGRLVHTETTYFNAASARESYKELGVDKVEIIETLDSHTCDICGPLDGTVIPLSQFEPGVTVPPFHPNCRGTTAPAISPDVLGERAARDQDGKVYYVPSNMKFSDWKQSFVQGGSKAGLTPATTGAILEGTRKLEELKADMFPDYLTDKKERKNTQALIDYVNGCEGADPNVVALYGKMGQMETLQTQGIPVKVGHGQNHAVNYTYRRSTGALTEAKITIPKLSGDDLTGQVCTTLHEEMHMIDFYNRGDLKTYDGWYSSSHAKLTDFFRTRDTSIGSAVDDLFAQYDEMCKQIRAEVSKARSAAFDALRDQYYSKSISYAEYKKGYNAAKREAEELIDYRCRNAMGGGIGNLEDIYDALSHGTARDAGIVKYGHGSKYYRELAKRPEETLANYGALSVVRPDLIEMLKADKPELVEALEEVIEEMLEKWGG